MDRVVDRFRRPFRSYLIVLKQGIKFLASKHKVDGSQ